jgi:dTDP-4-dehydrorhamnose 3,5-epimerase
MIIKELDIKGVYEIQLETVSDKRGNFARIFNDKIFSEHNTEIKWVQENQSFSKHKNTIRGLHFQFPPHSETKLVRCIRGGIYDVLIGNTN